MNRLWCSWPIERRRTNTTRAVRLKEVVTKVEVENNNDRTLEAVPDVLTPALTMSFPRSINQCVI